MFPVPNAPPESDRQPRSPDDGTIRPRTPEGVKETLDPTTWTDQQREERRLNPVNFSLAMAESEQEVTKNRSSIGEN